MNKNQEILKKLISKTPSTWVDETIEEKAHEEARRNARLVALRVLAILDEYDMTQAELAEKMGVSRQQVTKIVKGQENFTFETIGKLEKALGVKLMTIETPKIESSGNVIHLSGSAEFMPQSKSNLRAALTGALGRCEYFFHSYYSGPELAGAFDTLFDALSFAQGCEVRKTQKAEFETLIMVNDAGQKYFTRVVNASPATPHGILDMS